MKHAIEKGIAKAGVRSAQRHLFVCLGPDCANKAKEGEPLWKHIKDRLRQEEVKVMRTKAECFRICAGGPWVVIYPDGIWYGEVTPERFDRILKEHILGGHPIKEWIAAVNTLGCPGQG